MLNSSKRTYYNRPRFFDRGFYNSAKEKFVERYSLHRDVLSIYLFGQVSVPGISDLDFIVIMKDSLTEALSHKYSVKRFSKDLRYIYNETQPFLVTKNIYKEFWKIFPMHHLNRIYGQEINQTIPDELEARPYNLLILIEVCHHFYPVLFLKQLYSERINVRYTLLILNALKFPLQLFMETCGVTVDSWIAFMKDVVKLRESWFQKEDQGRYHQMNSTLHAASTVSIDLMDKLNKYIEQEFWSYNPDANTNTTEGFRLWDKFFIPEFDSSQVLENILDEYKQTGKWRAYLPLTFYYPLFIYSFEAGPVSRHIEKSITDVRDLFMIKDDNLHAVMEDRIRLMNTHGAFYKDNAVKINMVHSYYGYNPNPGYGKFYQALINPHRVLYKILKNGRIGR